MKVILNGATAGTNFGDFLFAHIFQKKVSERVGSENVYWYRSRYAMSGFFEKRLNNANKDFVKNMNALVYISGGYFCGDDRNLKDRIFRVLRYFVVGYKCIVHKIPYAIIGLEVAVPNCKWLEWIEKFILKKASLIVVRNKESLDCVHSYGIDNVIESVDSAFVIDNSFFQDKDIPKDIESYEGKILLFHVNPSISSNSELENKVVPILNDFLSNHPEYAVLVTPDQYLENQSEAVDAMCEKIECKKIFKYFYDDPVALCKVINCVDVVVTHKLHVGIVAARLGKSVISFSGHTEKIRRLYAQLGESNRSVSLSDLKFKTGCELLERYHGITISVNEEMIAQAKGNFDYLDEFLCKVEGKLLN